MGGLYGAARRILYSNKYLSDICKLRGDPCLWGKARAYEKKDGIGCLATAVK